VKTFTHYHGSDQFRMILRGVEQSVNRVTFGPRQFAFQESGMAYKEGVGGRDEVWGFLVVGDRRGAASTMPLGDNGTYKMDPSPEAREAFEKGYTVFTEMAKNNPGGPKGIPSVATNLGPRRGGMVMGSFADRDGWRRFSDGIEAAAGLWGDRTSGPAQMMLKVEAGHVAIPRLTAQTEIVTVVVEGSCEIDGVRYGCGDMRIQAAGARQGAVTAGPDGLEVVFMIADRRALPAFEDDDEIGAGWKPAFDGFIGELRSALEAT
jgi:hypothetical protein